MSTFGRAFGLRAFADNSALAQYQVILPFHSALQSTSVEVVLAVELTVAPIATPSSPTTLYFATHSFATLPTDDVADTYVDGRVLDCRIRRQVNPGLSPDSTERSTEGFTLLTNGVAAAYATLVLDNADGRLDDLASDYYIDGRKVTIKAGFWPWLPTGRAGTVGAYDDFGTVFVGWAAPWERGLDTVTLTVQGIGQRLRKPMATRFYLGTGSSQGPEELQDVGRPQVYGRCNSVECQLVDPIRQIRQVHDDEINGISNVYVQGVRLRRGGGETAADFATYVSLRDDAAPGIGEYATALPVGYVKLGSEELGVVTADVWGDKAGNRYITQEPWADGTYWSDNTGWAQQASRVPVDTIAGMIWRIGEDRAGLTAVEINENSLRQYDRMQPAQSGYWLPAGAGTTCLEGMGQIAASDHAVLYPDQYGRLSLRRIEAPLDNSPHQITDLHIVEDGIEQQDLPYSVPPFRWRVHYQRNWRRFQESEIAPALDDSGRKVLLQKWGRVYAESSAPIQAAHLSNRAADLYTFFADRSEAEAAAARMFALYSLGRGMWRVRCYGFLFRIELGETVHLTASRFKALQTGRFCICLAVEEDPVTQVTDLILFG